MTYGYWELGVLYLDLLALPQALQQLEQALALAQEVGSWNWIRIISGFLAPTYLQRQELIRAESILDAALAPDAPSQTIGQRLVWAARADLALAHGDPDLASRSSPICGNCAVKPWGHFIGLQKQKRRYEPPKSLPMRRGCDRYCGAFALLLVSSTRPRHIKKRPSRPSRLPVRSLRSLLPMFQTTICESTSSHKPLLSFPRNVRFHQAVLPGTLTAG
jgi:hypothetical protein